MAFEKKREGPTTTLAVHRCRFVDYAPSAITALAFAPLPLPSIKGKKSTATNKTVRFGTLAVGHANGNIDLCEWMGGEQDTQCPQAWVVKQTIPGPYPSKVDSLAFVIRDPDTLEEDQVPKISELRLFSSGGGSELIEWDIATSRIRQTINSQGGAIWSIAANPSSTMLALGCEDGTVRILSLENDTLTHVRRLGKVKSRMLSIAWGPPIPKTNNNKKPSSSSNSDSDDDDDDDEDEWEDSWLVTGCSDSSVRKWDVKTGQVLERMGTDKIRGERTLVWSVGVLGDGTIVSGDSMGMVKFWDSRTCTQLQSFQAHNADVLCLTISPEGTAVYTSGVDQKTVQFSLIKVASGSSVQSSRWAQTASKRMHSHDVRALAVWPPHTPIPPSFLKQRQKARSYFPLDIAPILASGGLDMNLVVAPAALPSSSVVKVTNPLDTSTVATFEDAYHRRIAYSQEGRVQVSKTSRYVSCIREAGLTVWRIVDKPPRTETEDRMDEDEQAPSNEEPEEEKYEGGWEKVLEMDLKVTSNIIAHRISDDGSWLAVSDMYETKLFRLKTDDEGQVTPKRVKDFSSILQPHIPPLPTPRGSSKPQYRGTGSLTLQFTPDSSKLVLATTAPSYILVVDLTGDSPQVLRRFDHHLQSDTIVQDRVIAGGKLKEKASPKVNGVNHSSEDVEMKSAEEEKDSEDEAEDSDADLTPAARPPKPTTAAVAHLAISPDGQWLASSSHCLPSAATLSSSSASTSHHTSTKTHIYNLDSIAYHTTLPSFPLPVQHITFPDGSSVGNSGSIKLTPSTLLLTFPNNSIQVYDVEQRQFPAWGKDLSTLMQRSRFSSTHDAVLGATFGSSSPSSSPSSKDRYILFWSATWLCKVSLEALAMIDFRAPYSSHFSKSSSKKRRRGKDSAAAVPPATPNPKASKASANAITDATPGAGDKEPVDEELSYKLGAAVRMVMTYRPILCADLLSSEELVVVERPLVDVLATLPPAYFKHRYGKS
ncbi:U3 small nucleolar RNA-associated protein 4 [Coprinopsis cinerea okayama7|uniref:U3 small nucleolar RNA-associated protein 4 n=1 Tax=Coprinopsis cinerea (strain Okayama-7 / 130 / ATCC MYA-4618 / FGSC 9003) TaxID=240176 RepID=A8N0M0_COPC7|nr:U3 small nucleolar RNA-associated protein 4 [Coprinopsis cinerea okayama7\|eukprot:XP_001828470.1 U3 small nucleolar RNA-associated protein 4 [Coprinopsis cinerea okayama7\